MALRGDAVESEVGGKTSETCRDGRMDVWVSETAAENVLGSQ